MIVDFVVAWGWGKCCWQIVGGVQLQEEREMLQICHLAQCTKLHAYFVDRDMPREYRPKHLYPAALLATCRGGLLQASMMGWPQSHET